MASILINHNNYYIFRHIVFISECISDFMMNLSQLILIDTVKKCTGIIEILMFMITN